MANIALTGSERVAMPGARVVAPADPTERLEVTVLVRRRAARGIRMRGRPSSQRAMRRALLTREEFATRAMARMPPIWQRCALSRRRRDSWSCSSMRHGDTVMLSGTVAQFNAAFNVQLQRMQHDSCSYRGRTGSIELPSSLEGVVEAVLGLDSRPQAAAHFRVRPAASAATSFTPPQVAALYGFPASHRCRPVRGAD